MKLKNFTAKMKRIVLLFLFCYGTIQSSFAQTQTVITGSVNKVLWEFNTSHCGTGCCYGISMIPTGWTTGIGTYCIILEFPVSQGVVVNNAKIEFSTSSEFTALKFVPLIDDTPLSNFLLKNHSPYTSEPMAEIKKFIDADWIVSNGTGILTPTGDKCLILNETTEEIKQLFLNQLQDGVTKYNSLRVAVFPENFSSYQNTSDIITGATLTINYPIPEWKYQDNNTYYLLGNVGIGITSPVQKLEVNGNIKINKANQGLIFSSGNEKIMGTSDNSILFQTQNATQMSILNNGSVGIGTSPTSAKLEVLGKGKNATCYLGGSADGSWFNFGGNEDTYIRGGNSNSNVFISDNQGKVGIGTTIPSQKLEVNGNIKLNQANQGLIFSSGNEKIIGTSDNSILFQTQNATQMMILNNGSVGIGTSSTYAKLDVRGKCANATCFLGGSVGGSIFNYGDNEDTYIRGGNSKSNVSICPERGNVGIGTYTPTKVLHVKGDTYIESGKLGIGVKDPYSTLDVSAAKNVLGLASFRGTARKSQFFWGNDEITIIRGGAANSDVIINDNGGNVGIGLGAGSGMNYIKPQAMLHVGGDILVKGKVTAREVLINPTAGADFVFDKNYSLMSLQNLDKFVTTHKHLPEIAPAADMVKNGVEMNKFQIQLLQKVEELTLYLIEQNKQNQAQNKRIEELERQNKELQKLLKK